MGPRPTRLIIFFSYYLLFDYVLYSLDDRAMFQFGMQLILLDLKNTENIKSILKELVPIAKKTHLL